MHDEGRTVGALGLLLHPPAAFLRNYLLRGGFRDGTRGTHRLALNSYYVFCKLVKLLGAADRGRGAHLTG